jgi:hypothetical protein
MAKRLAKYSRNRGKKSVREPLLRRSAIGRVQIHVGHTYQFAGGLQQVLGLQVNKFGRRVWGGLVSGQQEELLARTGFARSYFRKFVTVPLPSNRPVSWSPRHARIVQDLRNDNAKPIGVLRYGQSILHGMECCSWSARENASARHTERYCFCQRALESGWHIGEKTTP